MDESLVSKLGPRDWDCACEGNSMVWMGKKMGIFRCCPLSVVCFLHRVSFAVIS